jgi:hypothetical protein
MNVEKPKQRTNFLRVAILVSIICSAISAFTMLQINGIVHGQLYNYGLQFNYSWASPYWNLERVIYACLAVSTIFNVSVLAYGFLRKEKKVVKMPTRVEPNVHVSSKVQVTKENSMLISCPKCNKVFGKPLNMLDFSHGKTRLVNVCPYCNHILGEAEERDSGDARVILPERKEASATSRYLNRS